MIGEERFITAIITQAVEDASYQGTSKKYLKHKVNAIDWILNNENEHQSCSRTLMNCDLNDRGRR